MSGKPIGTFNSMAGLNIINWRDHLRMPEELTEFFPGLFSSVFRREGDHLINRVVYLDPKCMGIGDQIHEDMHECFTVLQGVVREEYSKRTLSAGDKIDIRPGMKHAFRRISDGDIILDLELTYQPNSNGGE